MARQPEAGPGAPAFDAGAAAGVSIREATHADLPGIVAIYNEAVEDGVSTCDLSAIAPEDRAPWLDRHRDPYQVWVAELDGIAGWIALSPYDPKPCFERTGSIATYVARSRRGHGIGTTLRAHLEVEARRRGFHTLVTRVWAPNEPSHALSRKFGWERVAHLREVVHANGRYIDCYLYQRLLERDGGEA